MDQKSLFKLITGTDTHTLPDLERITRGRPTGYNENGRLPNMAYNDAKNRMTAQSDLRHRTRGHPIYDSSYFTYGRNCRQPTIQQ